MAYIKTRKHADRYTVLERSFDEVPETIRHAAALGLHYMVTNGEYRGTARVYIFFDQGGLENYLADQYGSACDEIRRIISADNENAPAQRLALIGELLGMGDSDGLH